MSRPAFHRTGRFTWKSKEYISTVAASLNAALAPPSSGSGRSRPIISGMFFISDRFRRSESGYGVCSFSAWALLSLNASFLDIRQVWTRSVMTRSSSRSWKLRRFWPAHPAGCWAFLLEKYLWVTEPGHRTRDAAVCRVWGEFKSFFLSL